MPTVDKAMKPSPACMDLVRRFEGCSLTSYKDIGGRWTIGYGHTDGVTGGEEITQGQAEIFLECDLSVASDAVSRLVTVDLLQCEFDALCDFVFNLGEEAFRKSKLLTLVNQLRLVEAEADMLNYDCVNGVALQSLRQRRIAERNMFAGGLATP